MDISAFFKQNGNSTVIKNKCPKLQVQNEIFCRGYPIPRQPFSFEPQAYSSPQPTKNSKNKKGNTFPERY